MQGLLAGKVWHWCVYLRTGDNCPMSMWFCSTPQVEWISRFFLSQTQKASLSLDGQRLMGVPEWVLSWSPMKVSLPVVWMQPLWLEFHQAAGGGFFEYPNSHGFPFKIKMIVRLFHWPGSEHSRLLRTLRLLGYQVSCLANLVNLLASQNVLKSMMTPYMHSLEKLSKMRENSLQSLSSNLRSSTVTPSGTIVVRSRDSFVLVTLNASSNHFSGTEMYDR